MTRGLPSVSERTLVNAYERVLARTPDAEAQADETGVRYLQVDASADSRPILERLGLVPVTTTTLYVWTP